MPPGITMDVLGAALNPNLQSIEDSFMQNVQTYFRKFLDIWHQFGLDEDCISTRSSELWGHLQVLLEQMFEEDYTSYQKVQKRIRAATATIQGLANVLQVETNLEDGPLFKKEKSLQEELLRLTKIKRERIETYALLQREDLECRRAMVMGASDVTHRSKVPSETDIQMLKQQVNALKSEKDRRLVKFREAKKELTTILNTTEYVPKSHFEKRLLMEKEEDLLLSEEAMDLLENILSRARLWREELEGQKQGLEEKLRRLWEILRVDKSKRDEFLAVHKDCHPQTLRLIESEVQRLEIIRRKRMKPLVKELRKELEELWDRCHVSQSERRRLSYDSFSEVTGEVLDLHENEVIRWRRQYEKIRPILDKIDKRQCLWNKMVTFENNAGNPDRFKNRRGNLLKEEKERKQLQKDLPSLENEIFKDIEEYELTHGVPFLYYDEEYRVFVSNQWAQRLNQKEFKKQERRKQRSLESTAVSTPTQKLLRSTRSTPRKVLKSSGSSNHCTPLRSLTPNVPKTKIVGRLFSPKSAQKEDCEPKPVESFNATTYTVFVDNLNGQDRSNCHSSVLERSSKRGKVLKGCKSKKAAFLKKSARNVPEATTKLTPKRGKLGLPFLI